MEEIIEPRQELPEPEREKKNRKLFNRFSIFLLIIILTSSGYWLGFNNGENSGSSNKELPIEKTIIINKDGTENNVLDFSLFWKVWDLLKEKYVDNNQLDSKKLFYGAIKGMLAATGDPYTNFFDPEENKKFQEEIQGSFEGIGVEVGMRGGVLTVIAPVEDSPGEKAGLRPGDKIIKVDEQSTLDLTIDQSVALMRGKKGTSVKLTIIREGVEGSQEITIQRATINVKSVKLEWKNENIAVIRISQFGEETTREFNGVVRQISEASPKGIVIDVRNNPGGYLDGAVDVASRMLPKGKVVVIEENQNKKQDTLVSKGGDVLSGIPTVVLINEGSASASEILAGALRDNRENVTIMGEKSYGKGSVQEFLELPSGSAVKITVAKWLTPNGEQINEKGIAPQKEVKFTEEDFNKNLDPQLDEAVKLLSN
jgi:carboxyl-terminal processing protease